MYLPKALQCAANVTLRSQRFRDEEKAKDPNKEKEKGCKHTAKTGTRVTTPKPSRAASATTGLMEKVPICL